MAFNELRKDYLVDRWVIIATARGRRPTDFAKQPTRQAKQKECPMCPNNEHMTPPAVLVYLKSDGDIRKTRDEDKSRHKNWLIRVVPNMFPALCPPPDRISPTHAIGPDLMPAIGHHEVLIESPVHDEHPANARVPQLIEVINGYIDRLRELSGKPYVRYVSIFRNHGLEAGASLSHAHSQIIATPLMPKLLQEETNAANKFWKRKKKCIFCEIIEKEESGPRLVLKNSEFVAVAPFASINPLEFWILPLKHQTSLLDMNGREIRVFAETLKECLGRLKLLVNDPPYNYGFHLTTHQETADYYHWHLEVYPRLATWAGFEKSTGIYINTMTPETAAESMRKTTLS